MIGAVVAFFLLRLLINLSYCNWLAYFKVSLQFCFLSIRAGNVMLNLTFHGNEPHTGCFDLKVSFTLDYFKMLNPY